MQRFPMIATNADDTDDADDTDPRERAVDHLGRRSQRSDRRLSPTESAGGTGPRAEG